MIRVVVPPAAYPCTLTEAKEWARIGSGDSSQDRALYVMIAAATARAEHLTGRSFVERTLELSLDEFAAPIELPNGPILEVDSIKYTDSNRTEQTVPVADYEVDTVNGLIQTAYGAYWPSLGYGFNPIRIQYKAGYRPSASPPVLTDNSYLPDELRAWLAARVSTWYDNRGHIVIGATMADMPRDYVDGLLDSLVLGSRLFG